GSRPRRLGKRVGVLSDIERPCDALGCAVLNDRLSGGSDMRVVERGVETRPSVSGGTERHLLVRNAGIRNEVVVGADHCVDVDEVFWESRLTGRGVSHGPHSADKRRCRATAAARAVCDCSTSGRELRNWCNRFPVPPAPTKNVSARMGSMSSSSFNRPGAVDLSQLAQQAKRSAPASPLGPRKAGASYVIEVTEQTFEAETIRKSVKHPVVVELYSPRVATGQELSDALIEIANASDGKFLLARLNVDTAPGIVQAL